MRKKNWLVRVGRVLIAFVLLLGNLTACGGAPGSGSSMTGAGGLGGNGSGTDSIFSGSGSANVDPSKEYVYRCQDVGLPDMAASGYYVGGISLAEDRISLLLGVSSQNESVCRYDYWLITMNKDGSDMRSTLLDMPDSKAPERGEGTDSEEEDEASGNTRESISFEFFVFGKDQIYARESWRYDDYSPENGLALGADYVCSWNLDGSLLWETQLEGLEEEEEYLYVSAMAGGPEGFLYLYLAGDAYYSQKVSDDGTLGEREPLMDEIGEAIAYNQYLLPKSDGSVIILYSDEYDWTEQYLITYDPEAKRLGEPVKAPVSFANNESAVTAGLEHDLMYGDSRGIYCYNMGDDTVTKKADYINSDMNVSSVWVLLELDETSFFCIYEDNFWNRKIGIFTYVDPGDIPDKKVLVMAGCSPDTYEIQRVLDFNRNSQEYRIALKDYSMDGNTGILDESAMRLNLDIISGNMPDILIADLLPIENYAAKGLLADIGEMIENDPELSQVEFTENVFDACSLRGTLYRVVPYFEVETMIGKTRLVGDRTSWTMSDMQKLQDSLPEGTGLFTSDIEREDYFRWLMYYCGADYVDVDTGKCSFNTPEFMAAMEFGKNFPVELTSEFWNSYNWQEERSGYREDRIVLYHAYINNFMELKYALNGYMGEDVTFIGFPSDSGQGSVVRFYSSYCISSKSEYKEGAWEFLRYYLTKEYQEEKISGLSVRKDVLEEKAQEVMSRPYYWMNPQTGEKDEYDDTVYINGEDVIVPPLTKEQVDQCLDFIYSVDKLQYDNWDVMSIVLEELESYYSGQKTAEEVAGIIQNRVQLFVDENSYVQPN